MRHEATTTDGERLLTAREVTQGVGISRATLYRLLAAGTFPKPLKITSTAVRWPASEVREWANSRRRA